MLRISIEFDGFGVRNPMIRRIIIEGESMKLKPYQCDVVYFFILYNSAGCNERKSAKTFLIFSSTYSFVSLVVMRINISNWL